MDHTLDVSWKTIIKIFFAGFILYILFLARHIIVWLFFALVIALLLDPAINFLRRLRLPKFLSVVFVYLSIFGLLGLMIWLAAPIFIAETNNLAQNLPAYFEKINPLLKNLGLDVADNFKDFTTDLVSQAGESSRSIVRAISVFFGGISSTLVIFVFAFYISLEERGLEKVLAILVPRKYERHIVVIFEKAQFKVVGWFGARILACLFVAIVSFIIFFLFGTPHVFILSLISGLLNFVPFVGPLITSLSVFLFVGVSQSWLVAFYVVIALTIVQEMENKIVTPLLMKKFLDLPPLLVLLSILVGGTIFGFLGIIFVVPVFGIVYEFLKEFLERRKSLSEAA